MLLIKTFRVCAVKLICPITRKKKKLGSVSALRNFPRFRHQNSLQHTEEDINSMTSTQWVSESVESFI